MQNYENESVAKDRALREIEKEREEKKQAEEAAKRQETRQQSAEKAKAEEKKLAEEQAAEKKRQAEEQAKADAEAKKEAEEQRLAQKEQEQPAAKPETKSDSPAGKYEDDDGIFSSIKSYVGEKLSGAAEYAGGLVTNEIHVYDRSFKDGDTLSYYCIPSTKRRKDFGLIFKDEGYTIEVVTKTSSGKVFSSEYYWFVETDEGWKWNKESENSWFKIKSRYSELDKLVGLEVGKAVFDASKHLPNLGVAD